MTAVVAFASGILDGVSMIGLTIRTLVIIMMLAAAPTDAVRYAVMVCTAVTTVCGVWLAYGEPPNLIMKANLYPQLGNAFFLRVLRPVAIATYLVVAWQLRGKLRGQRVDLEHDGRARRECRRRAFSSGVAARRSADAGRARRGARRPTSLGRGAAIVSDLAAASPLGIALIHEDVPWSHAALLLGHFVS